ncbi:MAG: hypothetical protein JSW55_17040 [Chloroflexota bacterium]|nr:MAG: hypothetical protein JSW55_17040 [Chloroflexota bacterium]
MKYKTVLFIALLLALGACTAEPQTIVETVVQEATVEVLQTVEVEVTRQVEVIVEVTRLVEVTKEVPVEVTKIVEVVITATPEPTPTNTPAPTQAAEEAAAPAADSESAPPTDVAGRLLQASYTLRDSINGFRDGFSAGNCYEVVNHQDVFLASPSFDVTGSASEVQMAYGQYQAALEFAKDAALGIGQGCRDAIASQSRFSITGLNYNDILGKLDRALNAVNPGIEALEGLSEE